MTRRGAMWLLATAGMVVLAAGLFLGLSEVSDNCGSAFKPDYEVSQLTDSMAGGGYFESACRDDVAARRPAAYAVSGFGALALLLGGFGVALLSSETAGRARDRLNDPRYRI